MNIKLTYNFDNNAKDVFYTFLDKTEEFAKHIPNVAKAKVLEKEKTESKVTRLLTEWHAKAPIPLIVRSILKPSMLIWQEEDFYDDEELTITWKIIPGFFKEYFTTGGKWSFIPDGESKTKVVLDGIIKVYIPHFHGVPDSIAHAAGGVIEKTISKFLKPNLDATIRAIKKIVDSR